MAALQSMRKSYHIPDEELPDEELPGIRDKWRAANPHIVQLWSDFEAAAMETLSTGRPGNVRGVQFYHEYDACSDLHFLTMRLPSGRKLFYAEPRISKNRWGRPSIGYMGVDQLTKKWSLQETYGGKLVENCVQAIARDCLAEAIEKLEAAAFEVVFHVHDEVIVEAPVSNKDPQTLLGEVCESLAKPIPWAPGLPLEADGWVGKFYKKE